MGDHLGTEHLAQELLGDGAESDPRRGLPGGRTLENRAGVVETVLLHAGQIGVTGTRAGQRGVAGQAGKHLAVHRVRGHDLLPLGPLGVADLHRDRAAEGDAVTHSAQQGDHVLLEFHPGAAAVTEATPGQLQCDVGGRYRHTGRQSLQDGDEGRSM